MNDVLILLLLLPAILGAAPAIRRRHQRWRQFQRRAEGKGLRSAQRRLLWKLARQQQRNPSLLLRSTSAFELCVGEYARSGGKGAVLAELARIRVLLGFDHLPSGQPLRSTRQLAQGQTLSLWSANEDTSRSVQCLVIAASEPALVLTPLVGTGPAWPAGTSLRACFQPDPHHQYHFTTQLLERTAHTLSLEHTGQLQRLQVREYLRWDTAFPLTLLIPGRRGNRQPVAGQVATIGGGGLRVQVPEEVPAGTPVMVDPQHQGPFPLAGVKGRVVAGSRTRGRALHIQFVGLPRQTKARIVRRIYQHQVGRRLGGESRGARRQRAE
ncbi:MAG: PilZ domain-containing protein [Candidatus Latescibacteria bacterium]|nr:PilZ domain-containing protein [Candidatus Latescibacterota bacterium]